MTKRGSLDVNDDLVSFEIKLDRAASNASIEASADPADQVSVDVDQFSVAQKGMLVPNSPVTPVKATLILRTKGPNAQSLAY